MSGRNRSNLLLVEILIALLFFMLSATVLVQVFATAHSMSLKSNIETRALAEAQNVADTLLASGDIESSLADMGFDHSHGVWVRSDGDYSLYVEGAWSATSTGQMWQGSVKAYYVRQSITGGRQDVELFSLPCAKFGEAAL